MLVIEPHHIAKYSRCPRRAILSWNLLKPSNLGFKNTVLQYVIQAAHLYVSRKRKFPTWQRVIYWSELYFQKLCREPGYLPDKEYQSAVSLLNILYDWYNNLFLPGIKDYEPLINVPVYMSLGHDTIYHDQIPIVNIGQRIQIVDFSQIDKPKNPGIINIHNDLVAHIRLWGFSQVAQCTPTEYVRWFMMPKSVQSVTMRVSQDLLENAAKIGHHIMSGIKDRVFYPSFSEQCLRCTFRKGCSI